QRAAVRADLGSIRPHFAQHRQELPFLDAIQQVPGPGAGADHQGQAGGSQGAQAGQAHADITHPIGQADRVIPLHSAARKAPAGSQPVKAELWSRIYSRVGSYWKGLVSATSSMAGAAATQPTSAVIMKPLSDEGFSGAKPYYVWASPSAV
ncbi:hypothetical protein OY671_009680, partial [Metschnikowia pulcherrima]